MQRLPGGVVDAAWTVGQHISEVTMHAWDIAVATGQSADLDPQLGQFALDWGRENDNPAFRGDEADGYQVAAEVPVPDEAPIYDRLAGFNGRAPNWRP